MGARLRNWRLDTDRTRLAEKAKPSLKTVTIAPPHGDLSDRWAENEAIAEGVALTQTLVAEPPNILYPESFVERCPHPADLGVEREIIDIVSASFWGRLWQHVETAVVGGSFNKNHNK